MADILTRLALACAAALLAAKSIVLCAVIALTTTLCAEAANVRWDFVAASQEPPNRTRLETTVVPGVNFSLLFDAQNDGGGVRIYNATCNLATLITFTSMVVGDTVSAMNFGDDKSSLCSSVYLGATGEMSVSKNVPFYLGFQVYELVDVQDPITGLYVDIARGVDCYGWLGFVATGGSNVELLTSAIDLAGGPMVVGGGSAIPEPSGVLLVLLGLSAIALRRRGEEGRRGEEPHLRFSRDETVDGKAIHVIGL